METTVDNAPGEIRPVGEMCRGQAWVELHGHFTAEKLRAIADELEKNCQGLRRDELQG